MKARHKKLLKPFADIFFKMEEEIDSKVWKLSKAKQRDLYEAACEATSTNCWWAAFRAAPFVKAASYPAYKQVTGKK